MIRIRLRAKISWILINWLILYVVADGLGRAIYLQKFLLNRLSTIMMQ